jgi:hypothetical protein
MGEPGATAVGDVGKEARSDPLGGALGGDEAVAGTPGK